MFASCQVIPFYLLATSLLFASPSQAQVFVGPSNNSLPNGPRIDAPDGLSIACTATFNSTVNCYPALSEIPSGYFPNSNELAALCVPECSQSLSAFKAGQIKACGAERVLVDGAYYAATLGIDIFIFTYNYTCFRDRRTNEFCAPLIDKWGDEVSPPPNETCSDCVLGTLQMELNSPFGYDDDLASDFSSITSSCGSSNYQFTSPAPSTTNPPPGTNTTTAAPTMTPVCSSHYTVAQGDDCNSIAKAKNVSTFSLLSVNSLEQHCTNFPRAGSSLCIPPTCEVYTVQANDTCFSIAFDNNYRFSIAQLISWNPIIDKACSNLPQLDGNEICISYPGSSAVGTAPPPVSTPTTAAPIPTDIVAGTNVYCAKYYKTRPQDDCSLVTIEFGISLTDFYFLNPEVNSTDCGNLYLGYSYCVQAVGDIHTYTGYGGSTTRDPCVAATSAPSSCFDDSYPTTTALAWPTDDTSTANPTPTDLPLAPGTPTNCTRYDTFVSTNASVGATGASFDVNGCYEVAAVHDLPIDVFIRWNPSLTYDPTDPSACKLVRGLRYCTGESGFNPGGPTTTTTGPPTRTTGSNGIITPLPTQDGMTTSCRTFYDVQSGDGCYQIATSWNISLDDFYKWNPGVKGDCSALYPDYYVCVRLLAQATASMTAAMS